MSNTRKTTPPPPDVATVAALLATARLPERTVDLCLRGDLQARWETLEREYADAQKSTAARSLSDPPAGAEIAEEMRAIEAQMRGAVLTVTLRAMNRKAYQDLTVAHPPTDEDKAKNLGVNWESFRAAILRVSCVDPALDEEQWTRLCEVITPAQYQLLADTCDVLNHSPVDVPFSSAASPTAPDSDAR